jgi:phosphotransferase system HPr (HPr) family protein
MPTTQITLTNDVGLHARPAALFVQKASTFTSNIRVGKGDAEANGKSLLSLLKLDVRSGDTVTVTAEGEDADEALPALRELAESL